MSEVALVTDLHALEADNVIVQLHKHLLRDCVRQTEEVLSQRYAGSRPTAELIGILASIKFHNGWGVVCSAEPLSLQETLYTQEHPKENKLNRRSSVQSPKQYEMVLQGISKEQTLSPLGNCKHYKGEHPVVLSLVFPNEKECAILIQINATMRYRLGHSLDNPPPKTLVHEVDKVG